MSRCHRYYISFVRQNVVRDVQSDLLTHSAEADQQSLFHQALHMLEETSYCDFEVCFGSALFCSTLFYFKAATVILRSAYE